MQEEKYGFVYIWFDRKHKRYYIGSHWGTEGDGYICSSSWMKQAYKNRPEDFKRKIIKKYINSKKETFIEEEKWLSLIEEKELGKQYYNLVKNAKYHWNSDEEKRKTVGQKISEARKGIPLSEKARNNVRQGLINSYSNGRKGGMLGKKHTIEVRNQISEKNTGKKRSKKSKENISKGRKKYFLDGGINGRKGKPQSTKQKEVLNQLRNSDEYKKAASERMKKMRSTVFKGSSFAGKKHTEETKEKMRQKAIIREKNKRMKININNNSNSALEF